MNKAEKTSFLDYYKKDEEHRSKEICDLFYKTITGFPYDYDMKNPPISVYLRKYRNLLEDIKVRGLAISDAHHLVISDQIDSRVLLGNFAVYALAALFCFRCLILEFSKENQKKESDVDKNLFVFILTSQLPEELKDVHSRDDIYGKEYKDIANRYSLAMKGIIRENKNIEIERHIIIKPRNEHENLKGVFNWLKSEEHLKHCWNNETDKRMNWLTNHHSYDKTMYYRKHAYKCFYHEMQAGDKVMYKGDIDKDIADFIVFGFQSKNDFKWKCALATNLGYMQYQGMLIKIFRPSDFEKKISLFGSDTNLKFSEFLRAGFKDEIKFNDSPLKISGTKLVQDLWGIEIKKAPKEKKPKENLNI